MLLTYWAALAFVSRRAALLAGLMMATSILLGVEARLAKTDAVLLLTTVAAMGAMARVYLGDRRRSATGLAGWTLPAIFWTALAVGVLIKGPLILMFVGLAVGGFGGRRPLGALALGAAAARRACSGSVVLVLPWFLAIVEPRRRQLLRAVGRPRSAGQGGQRAGGARRAAGTITSCCSG